MSRRCCCLLALLLCGTLVPSHAFTLRKRSAHHSPDGVSEAQRHLADALKVINRERRRLSENEGRDSPYLFNLPIGVARRGGYMDRDDDLGGYYGMDDLEEEEDERRPPSRHTQQDLQEFLASLLAEDEPVARPSPYDTDFDLDEERYPGPYDIMEEDIPLDEEPDLDLQEVEPTPMDRAELEYLLGDDDDDDELPQKKDLPAEVPDEKREYDPSMEQREREDPIMEEEEELLPATVEPVAKEELQHILEDEDDGEPVIVEEHIEAYKLSPEEAEALKEAVEEEEEEEEEEAEALAEQVDKEVNEIVDEVAAEEEEPRWASFLSKSLHKEKLPSLEDYLAMRSSTARTIKRKRSGGFPGEFPQGLSQGFPKRSRGYPAESENDVGDDDGLGDLLEKFITYEDDQNDALVKALDLATQGQVERTDRYIPQEIQYLRQAIQDEQRLQGLGQALIPLESDVDDVVEEEEILPPSVEDALEQEEVKDELEDEELTATLAKALREYFWRSSMAGGEPDKEPEEEVDDVLPVDDEEAPGDSVWYNGPVAEDAEELENEDEDDEPEWSLNPFIRELWERYRSGGLQKRGGYQDFEDEDDDDNELAAAEAAFLSTANLGPTIEEEEEINALIPKVERELCPAIGLTQSRVTDQCVWSHGARIGMDYEARDLCKRHQLCYLCGSALDMSEDSCDEGYLQEARAKCDGDAECEAQVIELYAIMLDSHIYVPRGYTHRSCDRPCTTDYIVGVFTNK